MTTNLQLSQQEAASELLLRRRARTNLLSFTKYTFPDYRVNWHHAVLCSYLDKFVSGEIKRLIVAMPPRHGKSELVSRRLPAYIHGKKPTAKIIGTSYAASLAQQMNRDIQRIIDDERYTKLFPDTKLSDSNVRSLARGTWLRNSDIFEVVGHGGYYKAAGVGGGITGLGFDYGIVDDPIKDRAEANSETVRKSVIDWFWSTFYTRQQKDAGILVNMTRWHMGDLVGELMEMAKKTGTDEWVIVSFPAIAEGELNPDDPRKQGEPLWGDEYGIDFLEAMRTQNEYEFAALYQQRPVPLGGGLFKSERIEIIDYKPDCKQVVRFYDLAVTAKKTSDYTVGLKLGMTQDNRPVILDLYRVKKELPDVHEGIVQNANMDGVNVTVVLEGEKAGIVQLDYLLRDPRLNAYNLRKETPMGDKYTRAAPIAARVNEGKCMMVRADWNRVILDELSAFPYGFNDDIVDAFSGAWHGVTQGQVEWLIL